MHSNVTVKSIVNMAQKASGGIVISGAYENGKHIFELLQLSMIEVTCFCDNDIDKQGKLLCGIPVLSFQEASKGYPQAIYIIASDKHKWDIKKQLNKLGVECSNIILYGKELYQFHSTLKEADYEEEIQDMYYRKFGIKLIL